MVFVVVNTVGEFPEVDAAVGHFQFQGGVAALRVVEVVGVFPVVDGYELVLNYKAHQIGKDLVENNQANHHYDLLVVQINRIAMEQLAILGVKRKVNER